ncbi:putative bifunctional diguanylate cyclase/phosphodiesterase [Pseudacidobacterium ailaaui]|jgi:diguanylate cyclase (GGDEF)-like protein|uniref:putative bifunctional diguanylate cyclase/phosphodiesterase n=1 Tax=Pseudacidobacterium ailaaui TaxID=1382359 RepID=UPI000679DC9C|nr:bifunctional diguanylate cyclase/phosphodiesterase [Pseudacidobacterium ailaaui]MBX6361124.1 EAL domain-containing protein [Pseudacidobacterium ailaaui]MCL6464502.1 EAL domain-containing protein [Pseudacidobacterium ailaaui]MDI3255529.1 EAL domain-containing protein [Bacillota bacterium]
MPPLLSEDNESYPLALRASSEGFWEWDLKTGQVRYSSRWQSMAGEETGPFCARLEHWLGRVHPEDRPRLEAELRALAAFKSRGFHYEHRLRHRQGHWLWVVARGLVDRNAGLAGGSLADHTARRTSDPLTGLPNRLFFLERLEQRVREASSQKAWDFALVSINLERYRIVAEGLGFAAGDMLLMESSRRIANVLQGAHLTARASETEFYVLLEGIHSKLEALQRAALLQQELSRPLFLRGKKISITSWTGVAMATPEYSRTEDLLRDASLAMEKARSSGSSRPVCFSRGMREQALRRLQLEAELRNAIESGELVLHYQPEIDLRTGQVAGLEALVRWQHPERGLVPPADFIPIAEETGLILPLGDWVLRQVCRQLAAWRALAGDWLDLRININLSARQFSQPDLVERIAAVLEDAGVPARHVGIEMTESSLMADSETAFRTMQQLRRLGVSLHMDDFGTGYSSLNHLHRFPFDTLKIDRSFVQRMTSQKGPQEIVSAIIHLAHALKMSIIAEGIENASQMQLLQSLGCHFGQGYYFAKPLSADAITAILASQATGQAPAMLRFVN